MLIDFTTERARRAADELFADLDALRADLVGRLPVGPHRDQVRALLHLVDRLDDAATRHLGGVLVAHEDFAARFGTVAPGTKIRSAVPPAQIELAIA
jgi:hypothetical protein